MDERRKLVYKGKDISEYDHDFTKEQAYKYINKAIKSVSFGRSYKYKFDKTERDSICMTDDYRHYDMTIGTKDLEDNSVLGYVQNEDLIKTLRHVFHEAGHAVLFSKCESDMRRGQFSSPITKEAMLDIMLGNQVPEYARLIYTDCVSEKFADMYGLSKLQEFCSHDKQLKKLNYDDIITESMNSGEMVYCDRPVKSIDDAIDKLAQELQEPDRTYNKNLLYMSDDQMTRYTDKIPSLLPEMLKHKHILTGVQTVTSRNELKGMLIDGIELVHPGFMKEDPLRYMLLPPDKQHYAFAMNNPQNRIITNVPDFMTENDGTADYEYS